MQTHSKRRHALGIVILTIACLGCGEQSAPPTANISPPKSTTAAGVARDGNSPTGPSSAPQSPEVSPNGGSSQSVATNPQLNGAAIDGGPDIPFAEEGTPEWRLYEITRLLAPPASQKEVVGNDGQSQFVTRTDDEIAVDRKRQLHQVVSHAGQIIAATHADPEKEALFNNAVHYVSTAHVELALLGEADSARQLTEIAEALFAQKPESSAAVEAASRLLELAQRMGELYGTSNPEWVRAHATQARLFAQRFPLETSRCVTALLDAGRACEQSGMHTEARSCYLLLADKFGDTPFAVAVAPIVRRMNLPGHTLTAEEFGGPTIDGGYISIDQFRGRHVLVVFWSGESATFAKDFAHLQALQQLHPEDLAIVGVNLDLNESTVDQFLESHPLKWRQIFDSDPARRGTLNPVASYYGVTTVPLYWLIDPQGKVLAAPADLQQLPL